jgi:hypothetical protein
VEATSNIGSEGRCGGAIFSWVVALWWCVETNCGAAIGMGSRSGVGDGLGAGPGVGGEKEVG